MSTTVTTCGAPTPNGICTRKVGVGGCCPFHPEHGRNGSADVEALVAEICGCEDPLPVTDTEGEVRCLKCGHSPAEQQIRSDQRLGDAIADYFDPSAKSGRDAALVRSIHPDLDTDSASLAQAGEGRDDGGSQPPPPSSAPPPPVMDSEGNGDGRGSRGGPAPSPNLEPQAHNERN